MRNINKFIKLESYSFAIISSMFGFSCATNSFSAMVDPLTEKVDKHKEPSTQNIDVNKTIENGAVEHKNDSVNTLEITNDAKKPILSSFDNKHPSHIENLSNVELSNTEQEQGTELVINGKTEHLLKNSKSPVQHTDNTKVKDKDKDKDKDKHLIPSRYDIKYIKEPDTSYPCSNTQEKTQVPENLLVPSSGDDEDEQNDDNDDDAVSAIIQISSKTCYEKLVDFFARCCQKKAHSFYVKEEEAKIDKKHT